VDVTTVAAAPDPFSPAVADDRADSTVVSAGGSAGLPNNKKKVEYAVASYVVVSQGGVAVRTLVRLVPVAFPPGSRPGASIDVGVGEEWDGRDEDGGVVLDGTYDVRVVHALLGRKTSVATAPWPIGDALVSGLVATLTAGGPGGGGDGASWAGYGHDGVKLFGIDDAATTVTVDDAPPDLFIDRPSDGAMLVTSPVLVAGRVVDPSGAAGVWVNGLPASLYGPRFETWLDLEPGLNVIDVLAEDGAGNRATASVTVTFVPDTTGPTIVVEYPLEADVVWDTPIDVIGTAVDESGVEQVFVDGAAAELVGTEFFGSANLLPGPNTIVVAAIDGFGNRSEVAVAVEFAGIAPPPGPGDGVIHGRVYDEWTGAPLAGVRVASLELLRSVVAGPDGAFAFAVPPVDEPRGPAAQADGMREVRLEILADGYLRAFRSAMVPRHPDWFEVAVEPVYLVTREAAATVVGPAGGQVWNEAGTVFLDVPAGALEFGAEIRLTRYHAGRSLPVPLPGNAQFVEAVGLEPNGIQLRLPVRLFVVNDLGFAAGTELPVGFVPARGTEWTDLGLGRVTDDGAWLTTELDHFSVASWAFAAQETPAPIGEDPDPPPGPKPVCADSESGASSVSRLTGELQEVVAVGPRGRENGGGLSPWPLRFVYSSGTVASQALVRISAYSHRLDTSTGVTRVANPYALNVQGRILDVLYEPDLTDQYVERPWLRHLFDARSVAGELLPTGSYPYEVMIASRYSGVRYVATPCLGCPGWYDPLPVLTADEVVRAWKSSGRVIVRNEVDSPFGAGWMLAGLKRLAPAADDGTLWTVFDAATNVERFRGAGPGDTVTLAGNGSGNYAGDLGNAAEVTIPEPLAVAVDGDGRTWIAHRYSPSLQAVTRVEPDGTVRLMHRIPCGEIARPLKLSWSEPRGLLVGLGDRVVRLDCTVPAGGGPASCLETTVAGGSSDDPLLPLAADGLSALDVTFGDIQDIWVSAAGELFLAAYGRVVWKVDGAGVVWRVAGNVAEPFCDDHPPSPGETSDPSGDGGPARDACLGYGLSLAGDAAGNLYVGAASPPSVRRIEGGADAGAAPTADHLITRIVGTRVGEWTADGELAAGHPSLPVVSLDVSPSGRVWFGVAQDPTSRWWDAYHRLIRTIGEHGELVTAVGSLGEWRDDYSGEGVLGPRSAIGRPADLLAAPDGSLIYADSTAHRVRRLLAGGMGLAGTEYVPLAGTLSSLVEQPPGQFVLRAPGGIRYLFDAELRHIRTEAPDGSGIDYVYGPSGRLDAVRDAAGREAQLWYDSSGKLSSIRDFAGDWTVFGVDGSGDLRTVAFEGSTAPARSFTYDGHRLVGQTSGRRTSSYTYDSHGMVRETRVNGRLRAAIEAADGQHLNNDHVGGSDVPFVKTEEILLRGFPFAARITDARGVVREYASPTGTASEGWRVVSGSALDPQMSFDLVLDTDANGLATSYMPFHDGSWYGPYLGNAPIAHREYDGRGNLLQEYSVAGSHVHGRVVQVFGPCDRPILRAEVLGEWDPASAGPWETWQYDDDCRLLTHTDQYGVFTRHDYDPVTGLLDEISDVDGWRTRFRYDALGRVERVLRRDGSERRFAYDDADRIVEETDVGFWGETVTRTNHYDGRGRLRFAIGPDGATTEYRYEDDATGGGGCCGAMDLGPTEVVDPDGNLTGYDYDDEGRLSVVTDPTGLQVGYEYDDRGLRAATVLKTGGVERRRTSYAHDWAGRLQSTTDATRTGVTAYTYDPLHTTAAVSSVTDAEARVATHEWCGNVPCPMSQWNERTRSTLPDSGTDRYYHNGWGRLFQQHRADGSSVAWSLAGDRGPRMTGVQYAGPAPRARWDAAYEYDDAGRIEVVRQGPPLYPSPLPVTRELQYDAMGRPESETRAIGGRDFVVRYAYRGLGQLEFVTYPSGLVVEYQYQFADRTRVSAVVAGYVPLADELAYTPAGRLVGYTMGNDLRYEIERGPGGRVERITAGVPGDPTPDLLDIDYDYDEFGNPTDLTDLVNPARWAHHEYDVLDRLIVADGWWGSLDWTYDKTGNRLTETRDGVVSTYSYEPGTSRLLTVTGGTAHVLAYDDLGNATRYDDLCLDYDAAGRLVALRRLVEPTGCGADRTGACSTCATTLVQENAYDDQFRRTRRVEHEDADGHPLAEPACTLFFYDSSSRLLAEHDCSAGASPEPALNVVAEYVYLDGYHVLAVRRDGNWYWYVNDHLPTPRKLVDAAGAVVWDGRMEPFGRTDLEMDAVPQPIRSPGQLEDAAGGLRYAWLRHCAPEIGRCLSVDPASLSPTCGSRGQPYAFVANNPLRVIDPSGAIVRWHDCEPVADRIRNVYRIVNQAADGLCDPDDIGDRLQQMLWGPEEYDMYCTPELVDCVRAGMPYCGAWEEPACSPHRLGANEGVVSYFQDATRDDCMRCVERTALHELMHELLDDHDDIYEAADWFVRNFGLDRMCLSGGAGVGAP
jgi:RHS repeat-associated protein